MRAEIRKARGAARAVRTIGAALPVVVATLILQHGCGSSSPTPSTVSCVADSVCQPLCAHDPDCTQGPTDGSPPDAPGGGGGTGGSQGTGASGGSAGGGGSPGTGGAPVLPAQCPCPKESYCDLSTNHCVVGCTTDDQCNSGRICTPQRQCVAGCRQDTQCATGQICPDATLTCTTGCRLDSDCTGSLHHCDTTTNTCVPGCASDTDCPLQQSCDTAQHICVAGCQLPTTGDPFAPPVRCPVGTACTRNNDLVFSCTTGCYSAFSGFVMCLSDATATYSCSDISNKCRRTCTTNANCPTDQVCSQGYTKAATPIRYCGPRCTTTNGVCATGFLNPQGGACTCSTVGQCVSVTNTNIPCQLEDLIVLP
jgi:hypothetical protein